MWTLATVLCMVVTTLGIREIASRVADPLALDTRAAGAADAPLALATRPAPTRPGQDLATVAAPAGGDRATAAVPPAVPGLPDVPPSGAGAPKGDWTMTAAPSSTTRWARSGTSAMDQPLHALEYLDARGAWQAGYGNNADATLTSPWIDVPDGDAPLVLTVWHDLAVEPDLDGYALSWSSDGATWQAVDQLSGGDPGRGVHDVSWPLPVEDADRLRVRLRFTSDLGGSTFDQAADGIVSSGSHLKIHAIRLSRGKRPDTAAPIGTPWQPLRFDVDPEPHVVLGLTLPALNPYHLEFRDDSPRAYAHPSTYLAGYPEDAVAVWLSLDSPTFAEAMQRDRAIWDSLAPGVLYWFPGTRIIGAISTDVEGDWGCHPTCIAPEVRCRFVDETCVREDPDGDADDAREGAPGTSYWQFDDGTAWAAVAAGATTGTCLDCLLVHYDGDPSDGGVNWLASQGWIDLQAHPYEGEALDNVVTSATCSNGTPACTSTGHRRRADMPAATQRQLVVANASHYASDPVHLLAIAGAPGVVTVAGHDRGHVALPREGSHVVADYCRPRTAARFSMQGIERRGVGFEYSHMRAAGHFADVLLEARRLVGDVGSGLRDGAVAQGRPLAAGPLADGRLGASEWRRLTERTASPRPTPDPAGAACRPDQDRGDEAEHYLAGVAWPTSTGVPWSEVRSDAPTHLTIGYGALDAAARLLASEVMLGRRPMPERPDVDAWFTEEMRLREAIQDALHGRPPSP